MKTILIALIMTSPLLAENKPLNKLLAAIRHVESAGNDQAVGDKGKALGPYQIWQSYWQDACEYGKVDSKVDWKYNKTNAFNEKKARQVLVWYWLRYTPSNPCSMEILARIHNGGPKGHKKKATIKYWKRVRKALKK